MVVEFRNDIESKEKLVRLRRFVVSELSSYSQSEIEEHLFKLIIEHDKVTKKWGFAAKDIQMETVFSSDVWNSAIVGGLLGLSSGTPLHSIIGALIGGTVGGLRSLGQYGIKIEALQRDMSEFENESPVSYFFKALSVDSEPPALDDAMS